MGLGMRVFIVNDDETLTRVPTKRYDLLLRGDPGGKLKLFAGKRVRHALAVIDFVDRKPAEILMIQYGFLNFDPQGLLDPVERVAAVRLAMEMPEPIRSDPIIPDGVIQARHRFARKRYKNKYL